MALFQKGDPAGALDALKQATTIAPNNAVYWKAVGVVYASLSDFGRASEPFAKACRLDPRLRDACYYYGRNLYMLDRFEESLPPLQKSLAMGVSRWRVHVAIGQTYEALGRTADAAVSFRAAIEHEARAATSDKATDEETPHVPYGIFLFRQGDAAAARRLLEAAVREHPDSATARFELGRVLQAMNEPESAVEHLSKAIERGYGAPAHLLLGKTYLRLGKTVEAQRHLEIGRSTAQ